MIGGPAVRAALCFLAGMWLTIAATAASLETLVGDEARLLDRINAIRTDHHLGTLASSSALSVIARSHAEDMARRGYVAHINPEGKNPLDRVQSAGVEGFRLLAENIGASNSEGDRVEAVTDGWMNSDLHRENVLNPTFNTSGIGITRAPDGTTLIVQLYATF